ncbi:MAG TPA: hypothetical protein VE172_12925 [Stackebrandtia sp.]|jgi:hypothetical protein|uniref:hypothetical protein n=1 Tax=Stackebrandtia sp. TaxID=2023065 RepID=UPI002D224F9B|nr:hypothetical protein [Stackebrandtia sp.]HZE39704.1 hypothetical protein [Stackebrandtia sp.]
MHRKSAAALLFLAMGAAAVSAAPAHASDAKTSAPALTNTGSWVSEWEGKGIVDLSMRNASNKAIPGSVITISSTHKLTNVRSDVADCKQKSGDAKTIECRFDVPADGIHNDNQDFVEYKYPWNGGHWNESHMTVKISDSHGKKLSKESTWVADNGDSIFF